MKQSFTKTVLGVLLGCLAQLSGIAQNDYQKIIINVRAEDLRGVWVPYITTVVNGYSMNASGQFTDISYTHSTSSNSVGDLPYHNHLERLKNMAISYTGAVSSNFNSAALYNKIVLGLQYWNANINTAYNWWYNQIDYPRLVGQLLTLMRYGNLYNSPVTSDFATVDYNAAINYMANRQSPADYTGANRVDVATHWMYRAALTGNASALNTATSNLWSTVVFENSYDEGLNSDYAFLQHGAQFYTQSYGDVWISGVYYALACVLGTSSSVQKPTINQMNILYNYYHNAQVADMRGKYNDFSSMGRAISRKGVTGIDLKTIARASKVDDIAAHDAGLKNDSLRLTNLQPANYNVATPYHVHYWTGDFTMHNRPGYSFTVRSNSTRTNRTENINGENLLGEFLPDGATCIRVSGGEYADIYPLWDWNKVPGVTMREYATPQTNTSGATDAGTTMLVGGVSDSSYGASVYNMNYSGVSAKKSWFMFDEEVVCLGAGITSTASESVATSINQAWLQGAVSLKSGGTISTLSSNSSANYNGNLSWVLHDTVGYFFPSGGNISVSNQSRSGNWKTINNGQSNATVTGDVFKLWLSHGTAPAGATYAYVVAPGISNTTDMGNYNLSNIKILKNTTSVQAVKHSGLNILQVIFHTAGTIVDSASQLKITVDNPCALLVKNVGTDLITISLADPSQYLSAINVNVNLSYVSPTYFNSIALPGGNYKGSSVSFVIDGSVNPVQSGNPIADAFVRDGASYNTVNYGSATGLVVKKDVVGYTRHSYLKFDLRWIPKPVSKATLHLYRNNVNTNPTVTKWKAHQTATDWDESVIAWNNKPAFIKAIDSIQGQTGNGYSEWDVTVAVNSLSANELLSLGVEPTVAHGLSDVTFASREIGDEAKLPMITVDITPPNEHRIQPVADAYVRDGSSASTNFGTATSLVIKNDPASGYSRNSFLKFDLHGVALSNIVGAQLQLYGSGNATANASNEYLYLVPNNGWGEGTITWNNMPAASTLLDSVQGVIGNAYYTLDVLSAVQKLGVDSLLSFKILSVKPNGLGDIVFTSREGANSVQRPMLILYTTSSGDQARAAGSFLENTVTRQLKEGGKNDNPLFDGITVIEIKPTSFPVFNNP